MAYRANHKANPFRRGPETAPEHNPRTAMPSACFIAWSLALLLLPVLLLDWALETRSDRARRWRRAGLSQAAIADRLGCTRYRVRALLA
jgi:hypothetical protein